MVINIAKTKEIVFHRPNPRNFVKPVEVDTIEQLTVAKILGVLGHGGFKCDTGNHVDFILSVCSQRVYLLKLLRDRGLQLPQLHNICQSLIVSRILYALPAWGGLLSAELKGRIKSMHSCGACTNAILCTRLLTLNICWLLVIVNCLEICKSANIVLITYSIHARTTLLHFDPRVMSSCCLFAIMSYIGVPLLFAVFSTF